ncbi:uncharacterized protein PFL1_05260 [Pseudozyma flocculosa PF-1]|uniref:3',5'-cyclic-nucleotide phosphodiesterase n=2 Tax=Pseudozyma flocculosa TaxID=84751 RepID=A0A5C3F5D7_9BASI|nr:uncharacterized protein PFL1_05260 [Pseudozyma flocculosa PF-1]EPQ27338.1 hypothetical protein PFL1_05260 [Pseudozyma flocculosa PF-1]SPO39713.1 uncharacterized protein PSFLO_05194 [Pseudozyma flocculosa]
MASTPSRQATSSRHATQAGAMPPSHSQQLHQQQAHSSRQPPSQQHHHSQPQQHHSQPQQHHSQPQQHQQPFSSSPTDSFFSMDDGAAEGSRKRRQPLVHLHPPDQEPSFSFVCLGTGGGPLEGDCSCYLMKPADAAWQDGSIVVEGGSWLGALTTVLEQTGPDSAFYDFDFPSTTPTSYLRAGLIASFAEAFLISHAHLDHILGLVLGSASLPGKRAVYGLKPTLENILDMFNGKIWPKLASWNEDEPYTMYHMRALEPQRPYSLNNSLVVLPFALSHGLNPSVPPAPPTPSYTPAKFTQSYFNKRASLPLSTQMASFRLARGVDERARTLDKAASGAAPGSNAAAHLAAADARRASKAKSENDKVELPFNSPFRSSGADHSLDPREMGQQGHAQAHAPLPDSTPAARPGEPISPRANPARVAATSATMSPSLSASSSSSSVSNAPVPHRGRNRPSRPRTAQGSETHNPPPSAWNSSAAGHAAEGNIYRAATQADRNAATAPPSHASTSSSSSSLAPPAPNRPPRRVSIDRSPPSLDSTAFFITHSEHDRDVLFFGDVEPDCVSRSPRNRHVWSHAAERFAEGKLNAIFLECSFARGHPTQFLYGHLSVEHLFEELKVLAIMVKRLRQRRRSSAGGSPTSRYRSSNGSGSAAAVSTSPSDSRYQPSLRPSPLGTSAVAAPAPASSADPNAGLGDTYIGTIDDEEVRGQLEGLAVIIIHVKPALFPTFMPAADDDDDDDDDNDSEHIDGDGDGGDATRECGKRLDPRSMPVKILDELNEEEGEVGLGVRFVMAQQGMRIEC